MKTEYKNPKGQIIEMWKTGEYIMVHNTVTKDITIVWGEDGMCGASSIEEGLRFIGYNTEDRSVLKKHN